MYFISPDEAQTQADQQLAKLKAEQEALTKAMADRAIQIFPAAPDANALKGLACALEIALSPSRRPLLLPMARARLRLATSGGGRAELVSRLRRELERRS